MHIDSALLTAVPFTDMIEQIVKDDINDALEREGNGHRVEVVAVSPRSLCECEFCTRPDHQSAEYTVHIGMEGSKTMSSMLTLPAYIVQHFERRQVWIKGCVARLRREWER